MANPYDQFDESGGTAVAEPPQQNPYDQFDNKPSQNDLRAQLMASKLVTDASTLGELPSVLFTPSDETRARAAQQVATKTPERVDALGADAGPIIPPTSRQDIGTLTGLNPASRAAGAISAAVTAPGAIANSFATPEGALMFASPAAGAAFVAQMATSVPADIGKAAGAYSAGDKDAGDQNLIQGLVTAGMLALPAIHALKSGKPLDEVIGPDQANQLRQSVQQHETSTQTQPDQTAPVPTDQAAAVPAAPAEPQAATPVPPPASPGADAGVSDGNGDVAPNGEDVGKAIGANFDAEYDTPNGKIRRYTFNEPGQPHINQSMELPADATMDQAQAKADAVKKEYEADTEHTVEPDPNVAGQFNIVNPTGKILESFPSEAEAQKVLPEYNKPPIPSEVDSLISKSARKASPQADLKPGGLTPNDLKPALEVDGKTYVGGEGDTHGDIIMNNFSPQEILDRPDLMKSGKNRFFVDKTGKRYTRRQAADALGLEDDLDSETLNKLKQNQPTVNHVSDAIEKYEGTGEIQTMPDLVNHVEGLIAENKAPGSLQDAVDQYRQEQADDRELGGRGDMDEAGENFINELKKSSKQSPGIGLPKGNAKNGPVAEARTPAQSPPTPEAPPAPAGGGGGATAMKYKLIDQERAQRGLPPLAKPESVSDQSLMDRATAEIDKNPDLPDQLVDELNKKPRTIEDWERMVLLLRKIDLRDQYEKSAGEAAKAIDDSKKFPDRANDAKAANVRTAAISDKLSDLEQASRVSGSRQGAGLRALQIMVNEDYSLAGLETRARASKGGEPLTDAERENITKIADEYKKANDELTKHLADRDKQIADLHVKAALDQIALDAKKESAPSKPRRVGLVDTLKARADAARARINARPTQFSAAIDPTLLLKSLRDEIEIGAYHVARIGADVAKWTSKNIDAWKESMKKEFGDRIVPHLATILDAAKKTVDDLNRPPTHEEKIAAQSAKIKEKFASGKKDEITSQVQKLARLFIERGITGRDALIDAVHNVLKESDPEITRRDTMDAISGYGDFKQLTKDQVSVKLRDLKGQMQQVGKLEDIQAKKPPLKTGVERRTPSDEERKLIKQVNEAKRQHGVVVTDPATQLKSALEARKTFYKNQITDLQKQIDAKEKFVKSKSPSPTDPELESLKAKRDAVKKEFDKTFKDQAAEDAASLQQVKVRIQKRIDEMQSKIASGDFSKKPKKAPLVDRQVQELTAKKEQVAKKFKKMQRDFENSQLDKPSKFLDFISNLRRFEVLSGVNVLGKLAAYSATKLPTIGATEAIGGVLSKIPGLRKIAEKAPSESGFALHHLTKALAKGLTTGIMDAVSTARKGSSSLRDAFSSRPESGREWYNIFQTFHEVIKSPLRRAAFELSLSKRMEYAAAHGADITDPMVQLALSKDAYLDSDRALLLENNRLANGIRILFRNLEAKNKKTGQSPIGGKIGATFGRVEFPILSVPLNYVKQTLVAAFGLVSGSIKMRAAFKNGIENLDPKEADEIMRHLKYGTIGGAAMLLGFYDGYKNGSNGVLGGFYQPGEKRKDNQAPAGGMRIFGHNLPGVLFHNPVIAAAQMAHEMGALLASKVNKHSNQTHSIPASAGAAMMGLINQSPVGATTELATGLSDPRSADYFWGEHFKGLIDPQIVQELSNWTDRDAQGNVIKRNPQTIPQHIESGIPGLRQTLPVKRK